MGELNVSRNAPPVTVVDVAGIDVDVVVGATVVVVGATVVVGAAVVGATVVVVDGGGLQNDFGWPCGT